MYGAYVIRRGSRVTGQRRSVNVNVSTFDDGSERAPLGVVLLVRLRCTAGGIPQLSWSHFNSKQWRL